MTTPPLEPRGGTHPVSAGLMEVGQVLDRMYAALEAGGGPVPAGEVTGVVTGLERLARRVEALKLRLLASTEVDDVAVAGGFADTGAWLGRRTRTTGPDAARQARLAGDLGAAERTGDAFAAGDLSAAHARVITDALAQLPAQLPATARHEVESDLVAQASRMDPARLRRAARRALAVIEPDPSVVDAHEDRLLTSEEDRALAAARLTLHDHGDGTTTGRFTVPTLAADVLRKVIDAMSAPRRQQDRTGRPVAGRPPTSSQPLPEVDWAHRRGTALVELLEHLPTDHLRTKVAASLVVQLRHDVLLGALAAAGTDTDHPLSAGTARRLACGAGIIPAVLGGPSLPLDLGRTQRLFTEAQRLALATRHTHCAASGCQRPYAWCELHHRTTWSAGGRTDLADAVPLCGYHHRLVHHRDYTHTVTADGFELTRLTTRAAPPPPPRPAGPTGPTVTPKAVSTSPPTPLPGRRPPTSAPVRQ